MKLGIFVAYPPGVRMANQGLGRHFVRLIQGFASVLPDPIVIVCPSWLTKEITDLLLEGRVPSSAFQIVAPKGLPVSLRIRVWLMHRMESGGGYGRLWKRLRGVFRRTSAVPRQVVEHLLFRAATSRTIWGFLALSAFAGLAVLGIMLIALPWILLFVGLRTAWGLIGNALSKGLTAFPVGGGYRKQLFKQLSMVMSDSL